MFHSQSADESVAVVSRLYTGPAVVGVECKLHSLSAAIIVVVMCSCDVQLIDCRHCVGPVAVAEVCRLQAGLGVVSLVDTHILSQQKIATKSSMHHFSPVVS